MSDLSHWPRPPSWERVRGPSPRRRSPGPSPASSLRVRGRHVHRTQQRQATRTTAPMCSWTRPPPTVRCTAPRSPRSPPPPPVIPVGRRRRAPWRRRRCTPPSSRSWSASLSSSCSPRHWGWWPSAAGGYRPRSSCASSMRPPTGTRNATRSWASSTSAPRRCCATTRCGASGSSPWCLCPVATPAAPRATPGTTPCGDWAPPPSGSPTSGGCAPRTRPPHGLSW